MLPPPPPPPGGNSAPRPPPPAPAPAAPGKAAAPRPPAPPPAAPGRPPPPAPAPNVAAPRPPAPPPTAGPPPPRPPPGNAAPPRPPAPAAPAGAPAAPRPPPGNAAPRPPAPPAPAASPAAPKPPAPGGPPPPRPPAPAPGGAAAPRPPPGPGGAPPPRPPPASAPGGPPPPRPPMAAPGGPPPPRPPPGSAPAPARPPGVNASASPAPPRPPGVNSTAAPPPPRPPGVKTSATPAPPRPPPAMSASSTNAAVRPNMMASKTGFTGAPPPPPPPPPPVPVVKKPGIVAKMAGAAESRPKTHSVVAEEPAVPMIGNYVIGEQIGKGAFGVVYRAQNREGHTVAIKQLEIQPKTDMKKLMRETEIWRKLHHPNIVTILDFVQSDKQVNIILEFMETSLANALKQVKQFNEDSVGAQMTQVLRGLEYLHESKVTHCDIKAGNILATKDGVLKLTDFGVSRSFAGDESLTAEAVGSPFWMAPEMIEMKGISPAADIWSLGCTAIELLTGKPPYYDLGAMSAMYRIVQDEKGPALPAGISPELTDFLSKCFQKDPARRPTAKDLLKHPFIVKNCDIVVSLGVGDDSHLKAKPKMRGNMVDGSTFGYSFAAGITVTAKELPDDDLKILYDVFDTAGKNSISMNQAKLLIRSIGLAVTNAEFQKLKNNLKLGDNIAYNEFSRLYKNLKQSPRHSSNNLLAAFKTLRGNVSDKIFVNYLKKVLTMAGDRFDKGECSEIFSDPKLSSGDKILFQDWSSLFK